MSASAKLTVPEISVAYKEWAVIVAALASGQQSLLIRKGGIHEGRAGFQVAHREFWLYPTYFHLDEQPPLTPLTIDLLPTVQEQRPSDSVVRLQTLCRVEQVVHVTDELQLARLEGLHSWHSSTLQQRFEYRTPGVFVLLVRVFQAPQRHELEVTPALLGCKSWVDLPAPVNCEHAQPVMSDADWGGVVDRFRNALGK